MLLLLAATPAAAQVAFDIGGEVGCAGATSCNFSAGPIGAAANMALLVFMTCTNTTNAAKPTGMSVTWDSGGTNQAMTSVGSTGHGSAGNQVSIWSLANPVSGTKTLATSWTNSNDCYVGVASFSGADQTTPAISYSGATGNGVTASITQTPAAPTNGAAAAGCVSDGASVSAVNQTQIWRVNNLCCGSGGNYALGAGSPSFTCTLSGNWVIASVAIQPPVIPGGAAAAPIPSPWKRRRLGN